jgi:hypothetical protein
MGVGGQRHAPAAPTTGKDPVPIVQETGWGLGPVWMGAENLAPTVIRSPDLPARSESPSRLRHPGPYCFIKQWENFANGFVLPVVVMRNITGLRDGEVPYSNASCGTRYALRSSSDFS